jgi:hypothetical protein
MSLTDRTPARGASGQPPLRIPRSAHPVPTTATRAYRPLPVLAFVGTLLAIAVLALVAATSLGWMQTRGGPGTAAGTGEGMTAEHVAPAEGAATTDIKGWMTLQQVLDAYPVTKADLYAHFGIPAATDPGSTLSALSESGTSTLDVPALRAWIDAGATP